MGEYALITGNALDVTELYSQVVRSEGLEAVIVRDSDEAKRIVSVRGKPKLVMADLEMSRDAGFSLLREVQSSIPSDDRPAVLASVSRELRTTARDLTDALGIAEVLPQGADARTVGSAVRRALTKDHRKTETCPAEVPDAEEEGLRRSRLSAMSILHSSSSETAIDELLAQIAEAFAMPIVLISLTLEDGPSFKSYVAPRIKLPERRRALLDESFSAYVLDSGQPLIVQDASAHPTFAANELVRCGVVASGAGIPLTTPDGDVLGALCVFDTKPASIQPAFIDMLARLARRVAAELDLQSKARSSALEVIRFTEKMAQERHNHETVKSTLSQFESVLEQLDDGVLIMSHERSILYANRAACDFLDMSVGDLKGMTRNEFVRACGKLFDHPQVLPDDLAPRPSSLPFSCEVELRRPVRRLLRWSCKAVELVDGRGMMTTLVELELGAKKKAKSNSRAPLVARSSKSKSKKKRS